MNRTFACGTAVVLASILGGASGQSSNAQSLGEAMVIEQLRGESSASAVRVRIYPHQFIVNGTLPAATIGPNGWRPATQVGQIEAVCFLDLPAGSTINTIRVRCSSGAFERRFVLQFSSATLNINAVESVVVTFDTSSIDNSELVYSGSVGSTTQPDRAYLLRWSPGNVALKWIEVEYVPAALAECAGDLNGDNVVDTADLSVLLATFGSNCN